MLKKGWIGDKEVVYDEEEYEGEYSYVNGEWIFFRKRKKENGTSR